MAGGPRRPPSAAATGGSKPPEGLHHIAPRFSQGCRASVQLRGGDSAVSGTRAHTAREVTL